jgi:hypothetical protein
LGRQAFFFVAYVTTAFIFVSFGPDFGTARGTMDFEVPEIKYTNVAIIGYRDIIVVFSLPQVACKRPILLRFRF